MVRRFRSVWVIAWVLCAGFACRDGEGLDEGADDNDEGQEEWSPDSSQGVEDVPYSGGECTLEVADDCMDPALKCMPWGEGMTPTETRCCPLSDAPVGAGERCTVQDYPTSCVDDCPAGSMCLVDDLDTLSGFCQAFCDASDPGACGESQLCRVAFDRREAAPDVPLCAARCNPLTQDCESAGFPGWVCQPSGPTAPNFFCHHPTGPSPSLELESCATPSDCAAGLTCIGAAQVLGCEGLERCCTSYCEVDTDTCTGGNACSSLESTVPGLEQVGACVDPS